MDGHVSYRVCDLKINFRRMQKKKKMDHEIVSLKLQKQNRKRIFPFVEHCQMACGFSLKKWNNYFKNHLHQTFEGKQTTKITKFLNKGRKQHELALNLFIRKGDSSAQRLKQITNEKLFDIRIRTKENRWKIRKDHYNSIVVPFTIISRPNKPFGVWLEM